MNEKVESKVESKVDGKVDDKICKITKSQQKIINLIEQNPHIIREKIVKKRKFKSKGDEI